MAPREPRRKARPTPPYIGERGIYGIWGPAGTRHPYIRDQVLYTLEGSTSTNGLPTTQQGASMLCSGVVLLVSLVCLRARAGKPKGLQDPTTGSERRECASSNCKLRDCCACVARCLHSKDNGQHMHAVRTSTRNAPQWRAHVQSTREREREKERKKRKRTHER